MFNTGHITYPGRKLTCVVDGKTGSVGEAASAIALVNATSDPGIGRRAGRSGCVR